MIHNEYAAISGEEVEFYHIINILRAHGHEIELYTRSSSEVEKKPFGKIKAFFSGIYNPFALISIRELINTFKPDIIFIQNLFPLISPSILPVIKKIGVPVVMRVANYRLMCPNGLHLSHGAVCERCVYGKEHWCVFKNCEENILKSIGYAVRNSVARIAGFYRKSISVYICASQFLRKRMIDAGYEAERIHVLPNIVPDAKTIETEQSKADGSYVAYVGRISREKGVHVLLEAARMCPDIQFRIAGKINPAFRLPDILPQNVKLEGFLKRDELPSFYKKSRLFVSTSICFETFGISIAEAMLYSKPVIVSNIGVFPEFVEDGVTGFLSEPGNAEDLAKRIRHLWNDTDLCIEIGNAGRERVLNKYSPESYYERLITILYLLKNGTSPETS